MNYINRITMYVVVGAVVLVLLAAICIAVVFFIRRNGSKKLKEDGENYRKYELKDVSEFVPIEDITNDIIIERGGKRFIAVLKCSGSDFYKASLGEKVRIKNNYIGFIQSITSPIMYRQHGEDIDMGHTMKRYKAAYDKQMNMTFQLTEDYKECKLLFDKIRGTDDPREAELSGYLTRTQKKIEAYNWRLLHLESQMRYIEQVSGPGANLQKAQQVYVVDWEGDAGILTESMTDKETLKKAMVELDKKCRSMIRQLAAAGVPATRCTTVELIDICRRHYKPVTGNLYTMEDISDSSFNESIITTDDTDRLDKEFDDELVDRFLS